MSGESKKGAPGFRAGQRKAVRVSSRELTRARPFDGHRLPLIYEPAVDELSLADWMGDHRDEVAARLLDHGALLFRGFNVASVEAFEEAVRRFSPDLLDYTERAAPRRQVGASSYTSTEFPAHQRIGMHHEMSYSHNWPIHIWFYCAQPPRSGGRTPVSDERELIGLIPQEIQEPFREKKVMYVRNYGEGVDLGWREAFQSEDRADVEAYCRKSGIEVEWRDGDRLRTRQVRQAVATHPETGDEVWFNHAHMFHVSSLEPAVRDALLAQFDQDELPRNALYGDGTPIPDEHLAEVRRIYEEQAVRFTWQQDDVMLLDNFLSAHGREPFEGSRRIVVAMSDLYTNTEL